MSTLNLDHNLVISVDESIDYDDLPGIEQYLIDKLGDIGISASKVVLYEGSGKVEGRVIQSSLTK